MNIRYIILLILVLIVTGCTNPSNQNVPVETLAPSSTSNPTETLTPTSTSTEEPTITPTPTDVVGPSNPYPEGRGNLQSFDSDKIIIVNSISDISTVAQLLAADEASPESRNGIEGQIDQLLSVAESVLKGKFKEMKIGVVDGYWPVIVIDTSDNVWGWQFTDGLSDEFALRRGSWVASLNPFYEGAPIKAFYDANPTGHISQIVTLVQYDGQGLDLYLNGDWVVVASKTSWINLATSSNEDVSTINGETPHVFVGGYAAVDGQMVNKAGTPVELAEGYPTVVRVVEKGEDVYALDSESIPVVMVHKSSGDAWRVWRSVQDAKVFVDSSNDLTAIWHLMEGYDDPDNRFSRHVRRAYDEEGLDDTNLLPWAMKVWGINLGSTITSMKGQSGFSDLDIAVQVWLYDYHAGRVSENYGALPYAIAFTRNGGWIGPSKPSHNVDFLSWSDAKSLLDYLNKNEGTLFNIVAILLFENTSKIMLDWKPLEDDEYYEPSDDWKDFIASDDSYVVALTQGDHVLNFSLVEWYERANSPYGFISVWMVQYDITLY